MYRERCRPKYSDSELWKIYSHPWEMQDDWADHKLRIEKTTTVAQNILATDPSIRTASDLSCGDGLWSRIFDWLDWTLGDYAPRYEICGPIEYTIDTIDPVDIFFCCETIEHLDDPDSVLKQIRRKTRWLVLSTPKSYQWDENPEHYWAFDNEAVLEMLLKAGFVKEEYQEANGWGLYDRVNGYAFQIWGVK